MPKHPKHYCVVCSHPSARPRYHRGCVARLKFRAARGRNVAVPDFALPRPPKPVPALPAPTTDPEGNEQ